MKIVVIASSSKTLDVLKTVLQNPANSDQYIFLLRQNQDIRIDRIDLISTNILILDSEKFSTTDLRLISSYTRENPNPAIIYITSQCSEEELISVMRSGVSEYIRIPISSIELIEAIERIRSRKYISASRRSRGVITSFLSCKGGAGATFIATNVGYILANEFNKKVLFIDLHMQFGDASFYLAEKSGSTTLADIVTQSGLDSTVIAAAAMKVGDNYFLLQAPDSSENSLSVTAAHIDNLLTIATQDYDYVIVDMPQLVDSLVMKVLDRSDYIFIVMQPMIPYMRALTKMTSLLNKIGCDSKKEKIIMNRLDEQIDIAMGKVEDAIQKKINFTISNDYAAVAKSVNIGQPLSIFDPKNQICSDLRSLASFISGKQISKKPTYFDQLINIFK